MVQMLVLGGLGLVALATVIWAGWPLALLDMFGRDYSSRAHTWAVRAVAATVLAVVLAISVGEVWPADDAAKPFAGVMAFLVLTIALGIWFLAALVSHRDLAARTPPDVLDPADPHESVDLLAETQFPSARRSERGFGFDMLAVIAMLLTVAITGGVLANILNPAPPQADPVAGTPTETHNAADDVLSDFNDLHPQYEHVDALPENSLAISPWWYNVVDAENQLPYNVWHRAKPLYGGDVGLYLNNADLVLSTPGFSCDVIGMMVVETETTIMIGIVVDDPGVTSTDDPATTPGASPDPTADATPPPTPTPTPTPTGIDLRCIGGNWVFRDWFPVDLAAPLGDRTVQTLEGRRISEAR